MSEIDSTDAQHIGHFEGKVKWFSDPKGYGFISHEDESDIFVHHSAIKMEGYRTLQEGDYVVYDLMKSPKGLQAANVLPKKREVEESTQSPDSSSSSDEASA